LDRRKERAVVIRAIAFGLVGAVLASMASLGFFPLLFGFVLGVALSEFLRLQSAVYLLERRLERLETLDNLQPGKAAGAAQPRDERASKSAAAPPPQSLASAATPPAPAARQATGQPPDAQPASQQGATYQAAVATARRRRTPKPLQDLLDRMSTTTRIGIVVLFFGVSFLLKYAADRGFFPIEVRLLGVLALGLAIYLVGKKLQPKERTYGLLLRGAGIGIWYLCCYAASSLYHLIDANVTFAILVGLSGFTAWNAVRHDTRAMAIFAIVGGFLAPVLMSTGEGNHVALFTYYAIVNAGIVAIAYRQTWHELPTIGFLFTFAIGALWGATSYQSAYFSTTEPFLLLSAAFYLAVPILFAYQAPQGKQPLYRSIIVFGTPAVAFALQLRLVSGFDNGDVWSALLFGGAYALVVLATWKRLGQHALVLRDALVGIATVFFTLAIAFALDAQLAGALWAIEAAGGVWLSIRQQRKWGCYLSLLILACAGALWLLDAPPPGERLLLNAAFLQIALIALAGLVIALLLDPQRRWISPLLPGLASCWAALWWLAGGVWQMHAHLPADTLLNATGLYVLASSAALVALHCATSASVAGFLAGYSLHALGALGLAATLHAAGPLHGLGAATWPLAVVYLYVANFMLSARPYLDTLCQTSYGVAASLVVALGISEFVPYLTQRYPSAAAQVIALALPPLVVFQFLQRVRLWRPRFDDLHLRGISGALVVVLGACFLWGLVVSPAIETRSQDLVAWPLNLLQVLILICVAAWWSDHANAAPFAAYRARGWLAIGVGAFALANMLLLRFIHVHQGVAFSASALFESDAVQTTLSVFWTLVGVITVMWSSRRQHGGLWHVGMGLLAVVVGKLFLVDLAQSGTVERIVSFIAVGLLLMLVGWRSPRPRLAGRPKPAEDVVSPGSAESPGKC